MKLTLYGLDKSEQWDSIVKSFSEYDVYYLSGYAKAFALHGDGEPMLFYYEDDGVRGVNVVMKRDIALDPHFRGKLPENTYFDFATPYGYGGWLIEGGGNTEKLFSEYAAWCCENKVISEFVRFHPVLDNQRRAQAAYEIVFLGNTVAMELSSPEVVWNNITSKNRNMIRKAQKNGIRIFNGRYPEIYAEFKKLYDATMDRDHADEYYYFPDEFYTCLLNELPYNAQVFYAELPDGKPIAASIFIFACGRMSYHLSGSLKEYQSLAPANLLLYEAALWGCANGYRTLHLGGGVGFDEDSLYKFKKAFNRNADCRFHIGRLIFDREIYEKLLELRRNTDPEFDEAVKFFPKYRADNVRR